MGDDIIAKIMDRLREEMPSTSSDTMRRIERDMRIEFGGSSHYAKKDPAEGKASRLGEALAAGVPLGAAVNDLGCSRAWGYRLLNRRWNRR
jgi:hypothetical protein